MSRTIRKSVGMGGIKNKKSVAQFQKHVIRCVIVKADEDGIYKKLVRHDCSDRRHIERKYLNRKRRYGYEKMANEEINDSLNDCSKP